MDNPIHLQVITQTEVVVDVMAHYVDVPLVSGNYGILKNHAPLLGAVRNGKMRYDMDGESFFYQVEEGILSVNNNQVEILTRAAEPLL